MEKMTQGGGTEQWDTSQEQYRDIPSLQAASKVEGNEVVKKYWKVEPFWNCNISGVFFL